MGDREELGARLRGCTATQRSKKGSEKGSGEGFWGRVLSTSSVSRAKKRGVLEGGFCKMHASLGRGALSTKCTVGANILWYYLFPWP